VPASADVLPVHWPCAQRRLPAARPRLLGLDDVTDDNGRVVVIINPTAGRGARHGEAQASVELARDRGRAHGRILDVCVTEQSGHARELAAAAVRAGVALVVAWGGDGTVNEVASALTHHDVTLGIVPAGSGNGLGRDLGLPLQPPAALDIVMTGADRRIDAATLDERVFVNVAGMGLDARVALRFAEIGRSGRGVWRYVQATLAEVLQFTPQALTLDIDGWPRRTEPMIVAFANSRQYGNHALVAPEARLDDGKLDVVWVGNRSLWAIAKGAPALFSGRIALQPDVRIRKTSDLSVEAEQPILCHVDGEPHQAGTRVVIRTLPGALRVRVAASFASQAT
jgi:diacylglycerol kinase (ATP)